MANAPWVSWIPLGSNLEHHQGYSHHDQVDPLRRVVSELSHHQKIPTLKNQKLVSPRTIREWEHCEYAVQLGPSVDALFGWLTLRHFGVRALCWLMWWVKTDCPASLFEQSEEEVGAGEHQARRMEDKESLRPSRRNEWAAMRMPWIIICLLPYMVLLVSLFVIVFLSIVFVKCNTPELPQRKTINHGESSCINNS